MKRLSEMRPQFKQQSLTSFSYKRLCTVHFGDWIHSLFKSLHSKIPLYGVQANDQIVEFSCETQKRRPSQRLFEAHHHSVCSKPTITASVRSPPSQRLFEAHHHSVCSKPTAFQRL